MGKDLINSQELHVQAAQPPYESTSYIEMHRVICWRGYPHHRLPRIRFGRRQRSLSGSRSHNTAKKRQTAKHHIEGFGRSTPMAEELSKDDRIPEQNMRIARPNRIYDPRICPNSSATSTSRKSSHISVRSLVRSLLSEPASRTPTQRKALKRFTRELELHLQATKSLPNKTLVPSTPDTTIQTVEFLRPYRAQFAAAGLAVTSKEQRSKYAPIAPCSPPKLDGSAVSGSSYTLSSNHTILAFTPPHEAPPPPPLPKPIPRPRKSTHIDPLDTLKALSLDLDPSFPTNSLCGYVQAEPPKTPVAEPEHTTEKMSHRSWNNASDQKPLPDPVKRSPPTRTMTQAETSHYLRKKSETALPPTPSCSEFLPEKAKVTDKALFQGLYVTIAAACDEDVGRLIEEVTGHGIRRIMGDLSEQYGRVRRA